MSEQPPVSRGVVALVRSMRWVLWVLLLASVVVTLEGLPALGDAARAGRMPPGIGLLPVVLVGVFIVGYAVYRFVLVRAGRYPAGKAMVQLALMSLFLALLVRWAGDPGGGGAAARPVDVARALASGDRDLRALAAEVLRARPREEALPHAERLIALLSDPSPEVRRQARATLAALAGRDAGEGPGAAERWRQALAPRR